MKWNGRTYKSGYGINVYPKPEDSIKELLLPLSEKKRKGNIWIPVLNQVINVTKETTTPVPVSPSPTPTSTITPTPTQTGSPTPTPTPSETPPAVLPSGLFIQSFSSTNLSETRTYSSDWGQAGLVVAVIGSEYGGNVGNFSATLGGVSMTQATSGEFSPGGTNKHLQKIFFLDTLSTTGNLVVNSTTNMQSTIAGVYRLDNILSTTPEFAGVSEAGTFTNPRSLTTTSISADSIGIGGCLGQPSVIQTFTNWTQDSQPDNGLITQGFGNFVQASVGTRTVTVQGQLSNMRSVLGLAVWR